MKYKLSYTLFCLFIWIVIFGVSGCNISLDSFLFYAVCSGNTSLVKSLLDKGYNANAISTIKTPHCRLSFDNQDLEGWTPLMLAIMTYRNLMEKNEKFLNYKEQQEVIIIIKLLLEKGADVNAKDKYGDTALMLAVNYVIENIVEILVNNGAFLNEKDRSERTPLMIIFEKDVAYSDSSKVSIIDTLLKAGANVNTKDSYGTTVLMYAINSRYTNPEFNLRIVERLLEKGADVNAKQNDDAWTPGKTALMLAASHGSTEIVERLLEKGADVNAKDKYGDTALMLATHFNHESVVKVLLASGADTNKALDIAARNGYVSIVNILLSKIPGSSQSARDVVATLERRHVALFIVDDYSSYSSHGRRISQIIKNYIGGYNSSDRYSVIKIFEIDLTSRISSQSVSNSQKLIDALLEVQRYTSDHPNARIVVNMSWGTDIYDILLEEYFTTLNRRGVIFVAAVGNEGKPTCLYPAAYPGVIAVASVVRSGEGYRRAPHSNWGYCVDVATLDHNTKDNPIGSLSQLIEKSSPNPSHVGTSIATAYTTGKIVQIITSNMALTESEIIDSITIINNDVTGFNTLVGILE